MKVRPRRPWSSQASVVVPLILGGVLLSAYGSLMTGGRNDIRLLDLFAKSTNGSVVWDIRMPRTLVAACLGINLGVSGLILQAITRNPLSSPSILGINQGAAFGLTFGIIFPAVGAGFGLMPLAATGALCAGLLTFTVAGVFTGRINPLRLILGGVAVGAFASAMVRFSFTLEDDLARQVLRWTLGSISDVRWHHVQSILGWSIGGTLGTLLLAHRFNLMSLGEAQATGLGADPRITLLLGALMSACMIGVAVFVAGPIAFAGLVVPHMCRFCVGPDHRILVPTTALGGACLLMASDAVSKLLTNPIELPVGVVVAMIGAPYFLYQTLFSKDAF